MECTSEKGISLGLVFLICKDQNDVWTKLETFWREKDLNLEQP